MIIQCINRIRNHNVGGKFLTHGPLHKPRTLYILIVLFFIIEGNIHNKHIPFLNFTLSIFTAFTFHSRILNRTVELSAPFKPDGVELLAISSDRSQRNAKTLKMATSGHFLRILLHYMEFSAQLENPNRGMN